MRLDDIVYTFNVKTGKWGMLLLNNASKGNNIIPNISLDVSKNTPIINNMDLENRTKAMHNKELEELKLKISEKKSRIEESNKRLADSKETQKSLIENYIRETLEVEKIKEAREKLDKLKKELGKTDL